MISFFNRQRNSQLGLLQALVVRDLEAKYKGSSLGNFWPVAHQVSQLVIYTYVFAIVLKVKLNLAGLESNSFTFGLWLYAGLLPWTALTNGMVQASAAVVGQPNLVKKVVFPLGLLPLVPVLSSFVESSVGFVLLVALAVVTKQTMHPTLFLMPFVWLTQLLMTAGLAYLVAGLTVFIRDIPQSLIVIINTVFYLTPIVYPISVIPEAWRDWILWLNPIATIVELYRELILLGTVSHWGEWLVAWAVAIVLFVVGRRLYRRLRPGFADVL